MEFSIINSTNDLSLHRSCFYDKVLNERGRFIVLPRWKSQGDTIGQTRDGAPPRFRSAAQKVTTFGQSCITLEKFVDTLEDIGILVWLCHHRPTKNTLVHFNTIIMVYELTFHHQALLSQDAHRMLGERCRQVLHPHGRNCGKRSFKIEH